MATLVVRDPPSISPQLSLRLIGFFRDKPIAKQLFDGTLLVGDGSQSAADQALAEHLVSVGYQAQDTCDVLVMARCKAKAEKVGADYYARVYAEARERYNRRQQRQPQPQSQHPDQHEQERQPQAEPQTETAPAQLAQPEPQVNEADDDPHRIARLYLEGYRADGVSTLVFWRDEIHRWDGSRSLYRAVPDGEVRGEVVRCIKREFDRISLAAREAWQEYKSKNPNAKPPNLEVQQVTSGLTNNVLQALNSEALLPGTVLQPAWLGAEAKARPGPYPANEMIAFRNGLVHLPSLAEGKVKVLAPTPRFFTANALDYDFDPSPPRPQRWHAFLKELWPKDPWSIDTLQEWFGYSLLPDTSQQKILLIIGPGRGGKGTIGRVQRAMLGPENVCSPSLATLAGPFGLQDLLGKTLAIIGDCKLSSRADAAAITERLKGISGEDPQNVNRKYLPEISVVLLVRIMILTNEIPKLDDASGVIASRQLILRLTESWLGREDPALTSKLLAELPGILLWAVAGLKRLRDRGHFIQPTSGKQVRDMMEDLASPVKAWIRECCEVGPTVYAEPSALYASWCAWCAGKGLTPQHEIVFGRDLHAALPTLARAQRKINGERRPVTLGVRLRTNG
jgi:putative DNA primase/helicase